MVSVDGEFCAGAVAEEPGAACDDCGDASGLVARVGGTDWAQGFQSVADVADDGAVRVCQSAQGGAGADTAAGAVSGYFVGVDVESSGGGSGLVAMDFDRVFEDEARGEAQ